MSRFSIGRLRVAAVSAVVFAAAAMVPAATFAAGGTTHWVNDDKPVVAAPGQNCNKPGYNTIQAAVNAAAATGDTVRVCAGTYAGAVVDRAVDIRADNGVTVNTGPESHPGVFRAAFIFNLGQLPTRPGSGATIRGFRIVGARQFTPALDDGKLDFGVFSRGVDDVNIRGNQMSDLLQAVTDWNGTGWDISLNDIRDPWTRNGGGIGILVGGFDGVTDVVRNVVSLNRVRGTLQVDPLDSGGYDGTGIVMYADFRYGRPGAPSVSHNAIVGNEVRLTSDTPSVVDVNSIELSVAPDDVLPVPMSITENYIAFNAVGGTPRTGIRVSDGTGDNLVAHNIFRGATEFSCWDGSTGTGTAGTANSWKKNIADAPSSPAGICRDHGHGHGHDDD